MVIEYPSIKHLDLTEQTYRFLKDRILKREIHPGEKISVEEIAHGLGVSRTPVVNALKILESDGLVDIVPRRGTFVTHLNARDVAELFEIRQIIELHAAEQVFREGKINLFLDAIERPMSQMQGAIADGDYVDYEMFINADRDLHMNLVRFLDNRRLIQIYSDLNIHMQVARAHYLETVENAVQAQKEHESMLNAIKARDLNELKRDLSDHIGNVRKRILTLLDDRGGKL
jgi:DNA-binding GntR family transcriptional regulator